MTTTDDYLCFRNDNYSIYVIRTSNIGFINYCYLLADVKNELTILIDPSWEFNKINELLVSIGMKLTAILLTHSHYDHTNLVNDFILEHKAKAYMSQQEIEWYGFRCLGLTAVEDNQLLEFGNIKIKCILTPGHTFGSMCYMTGDCLYCGDTVFIEGCGSCDFIGSDPGGMFDSLQKLKHIIMPDVRVMPGHSFGKKPGELFGKTCRDNIYFNINERGKFIEFRMRADKKSIAFV